MMGDPLPAQEAWAVWVSFLEQGSKLGDDAEHLRYEQAWDTLTLKDRTPELWQAVE